MKKTVWYIQQWPGKAVSINLVKSYKEQLDGVHIKYFDRDDDPFDPGIVSAVVPMSDLAFSYTEAARSETYSETSMHIEMNINASKKNMMMKTSNTTDYGRERRSETKFIAVCC